MRFKHKIRNVNFRYIEYIVRYCYWLKSAPMGHFLGICVYINFNKSYTANFNLIINAFRQLVQAGWMKKVGGNATTPRKLNHTAFAPPNMSWAGIEQKTRGEHSTIGPPRSKLHRSQYRYSKLSDSLRADVLKVRSKQTWGLIFN